MPLTALMALHPHLSDLITRRVTYIICTTLLLLPFSPGTLTDAALKPLTAITGLTSLDVFGVRLTDAGAALIGAHLPRLRQLEACGGGITGGLAVS